eukprot:269615-Prorocentrum_minimum.AAC.5
MVLATTPGALPISSNTMSACAHWPPRSHALISVLYVVVLPCTSPSVSVRSRSFQRECYESVTLRRAGLLASVTQLSHLQAVRLHHLQHLQGLLPLPCHLARVDEHVEGHHRGLDAGGAHLLEESEALPPLPAVAVRGHPSVVVEHIQRLAALAAPPSEEGHDVAEGALLAQPGEQPHQALGRHRSLRRLVHRVPAPLFSPCGVHRPSAAPTPVPRPPKPPLRNLRGADHSMHLGLLGGGGGGVPVRAGVPCGRGGGSRGGGAYGRERGAHADFEASRQCLGEQAGVPGCGAIFGGGLGGFGGGDGERGGAGRIGGGRGGGAGGGAESLPPPLLQIALSDAGDFYAGALGWGGDDSANGLNEEASIVSSGGGFERRLRGGSAIGVVLCRVTLGSVAGICRVRLYPPNKVTLQLLPRVLGFADQSPTSYIFAHGGVQLFPDYRACSSQNEPQHEKRPE